MPFDVLGCTRATLMRPESCGFNLEKICNGLTWYRDRDQLLQLLAFNEEFLVCANNQFV